MVFKLIIFTKESLREIQLIEINREYQVSSTFVAYHDLKR